MASNAYTHGTSANFTVYLEAYEGHSSYRWFSYKYVRSGRWLLHHFIRSSVEFPNG